MPEGSPTSACKQIHQHWALSRGETHDPVHGSFINLMKLPNEGTPFFFGTSVKPFHILMSFL